MAIQIILTSDVVRTTGVNKINSNFLSLENGKANLSGGNGFTGNQVIGGNIKLFTSLGQANGAKIGWHEGESDGQSFGIYLDGASNRLIMDSFEKPGIMTWVRSTGNVGIGTTNPASITHIYQNDSSINSGLTIEQAGTGDAIMHFLLTGTRRWFMYADNSDSDKFKIGTGAYGTSVLSIDTSGTVSIGTSVGSGELLNVAGSTNINGYLRINRSANIQSQITGSNDPLIYATGQNGSYPFNGLGNLIIQPRNSASRSVFIGSNFGLVVSGSGRINMSSLPTSSSGLSSGDLWRNGTDIRVV